MVIEEDWGISVQRIRDFFAGQADVRADGEGFVFGQCRMTLTALADRFIGTWPMPRTCVRMEGPEDDVQTIHRRFFLRFLSAGG